MFVPVSSVSSCIWVPTATATAVATAIRATAIMGDMGSMVLTVPMAHTVPTVSMDPMVLMASTVTEDLVLRIFPRKRSKP